MADRKERFALLSRFEKLYKFRYDNAPIINKNTEQWAADAIVESFGLQQSYEILEYYFNISPNPSWKAFANNADKLLQSIRNKQEDDEQRRVTRLKAKEWLSR